MYGDLFDPLMAFLQSFFHRSTLRHLNGTAINTGRIVWRVVL